MRVIESWPLPGTERRHPTEAARYDRRNQVKKTVRWSSLGWVLMLVALTASMVVLPLMLPPLPPPPMLLLFFPVGIMAALVFLAFSPTEAAGVGYGVQGGGVD